MSANLPLGRWRFATNEAADCIKALSVCNASLLTSVSQCDTSRPVASYCASSDASSTTFWQKKQHFQPVAPFQPQTDWSAGASPITAPILAKSVHGPCPTRFRTTPLARSFGFLKNSLHSSLNTWLQPHLALVIQDLRIVAKCSQQSSTPSFAPNCTNDQ